MASTELEVAAPQSVTLFRADEPDEVVARATKVANALAEVVRKQQLTSNIQGKNYPRVEAWTLLGSILGVFPITAWTKPIVDSQGVTQGWEARVEARTISGALVGAAEAECLRSESAWGWNPKDRYGKALKARDDFALRSMAATRATGKALRLPLGFVMSLAGFEATPAEEMEGVIVDAEVVAGGETRREAATQTTSRAPASSPGGCPDCSHSLRKKKDGSFFCAKGDGGCGKGFAADDPRLENRPGGDADSLASTSSSFESAAHASEEPPGGVDQQVLA